MKTFTARQSLSGTLTIVSGTWVSEPVYVAELDQIGLVTPSGWTAAQLGFKVGPLESQMQLLTTSANTVYAVSITCNRALSFTLGPWRYVQVASVTNGAATNQEADRVFQLSSKS